MEKDIFKVVDVIITEQKKARRNNDYNTLLLNAEALLEYLPDLILKSVHHEGQYRKHEASLLDEKDDSGKRNSSAYCETKAKATDFYLEWQKTKQFIDLMYEMVQMAKKLAGSVDKEFNIN